MVETRSDINTEGAFYRKKFLLSIIIPGIFVFLMWLVKITELLFEIDFSGFGIYPLTTRGLPGIIFSPFIHADFKHLFNNSLPLFLLSVALFYFYSEVALKVFIWTYFLTGSLVWIAGREAWHIGASGLVYGLASFLFFSGIIRRYFRLIALSLLIVFLYGSMVWGIFPGTYKNVSWESHMLGFFSGVVLSVWYRKEGPQKPVYEWMEVEEKGRDGDGEKPSSPKANAKRETYYKE
ncbi:MAG: rhomboid family intramembrane serine protease [Bacteroidia bacterium]|nr:rhomboid family intramembrane serine protease [Bacteroidia bacterium]